MRCLISLLPFALLTGCATTSDPGNSRQVLDQEIATIAALPEDGSRVELWQRCLSTRSYDRIEVLGNRHLLFTRRGARQWLNVLPMSCPGLHSGSALAVELRSAQICKLDSFQVVDWWQWHRFRRWPWRWWNGVHCSLGEFLPVTEEQADAVRDVLENSGNGRHAWRD